jgi:hypothetical protein
MSAGKRNLAAATAVAAVVAAAGCGGSTGPVSTAELIEQGDQLCAEEQKRFREIQVQAPASAADAVDQTNELVDVSQETTDGLSEIEPPSNLRSAYDRYLDARREAQQLLERGRDAAERHDRVGYNSALKKSIAGEGQRQKLARKVGFEVCGEPQGPG